MTVLEPEHAFGAVEARLTRARAADTEPTRLARRSASASGLGAGLGTAASGLTLWGVIGAYQRLWEASR